MPPPLAARVGKAQRAAVARRARCCANSATTWSNATRTIRPARCTVMRCRGTFAAFMTTSKALPHPDRLERRTRAFVRIGGFSSDRRMAVIRSPEKPTLARAGPVDLRRRRRGDHAGHGAGPSRIGAYQRRGASSTLALVAAGRRSR